MVVAANASAPFIIYQCAEYMCTMLALLALCFFKIENFLPFDPLHIGMAVREASMISTTKVG